MALETPSPLCARRFLAWVFAVLALASPAFAQSIPKARTWTDCDSVCLSLVESIKAQPETLVMRLEDALVIRRECAGEIVSAALGAVGPNRALREKVVQTALKVAPEKSRIILYAARNPTRPAPIPMVDEDALLAASGQVTVLRAIVPTEEIRRAALPGEVVSAPPPGREPEVRRAIRLTEQPVLEVEIRSAEMARPGLPRLNLTQRRR